MGKILRGLVNKNLTAKTRLFEWIGCILPETALKVGDKIDLFKLLGRKCKIITKQKPRIYNEKQIMQSRVVDVLRL